MDSLNAIRKSFDQLVTMTDDDWFYFREKLHQTRFKRTDIITRFGQIENRLYFLTRGIVRHIVNTTSIETTSDFAFPGQFFSSYSSFISRRPSIYEIRPVTSEVDCYYLGYDSLQDVYLKTM